jgi:paraquat-inducible protein A
MTYLLITAGTGGYSSRLKRARLYRGLEFIGRWSMLDIYVLTILCGLVQLKSLATIIPQMGAAAFGGVVVLTMLATMSFDPRLIWDKRPV